MKTTTETNHQYRDTFSTMFTNGPARASVELCNGQWTAFYRITGDESCDTRVVAYPSREEARKAVRAWASC